MRQFIKEAIKAFLLGIIIFIIRKALTFINGGVIALDEEFLLDFIFNQTFALVLYLANAYFVMYMIKRFKQELFTIKKMLVAILSSIFITLISIFVIRLCIKVLVYDVPLQKFLQDERLGNYQYSLVLSVIITLLFYAFFYYKSVQDRKVKEQKVIAGAASAKFDALKNQLDPHFLFNSLNVLSSLIDENTASAQKFTTALSKVYRYVLEQKNKELVTVDEELQFAKTYMSLLKMRFEDSIVFEIPERASNPESRVVPLSLQLLLENAVKHNMVTSSKPLHIKIFESGGNLVVENNLQPKQIVKKSSGVGLSNIKERYHLLTNRKVSINQQAGKFTVGIPMLTKQISIMRTQSKEEFDDSYVRARKHVEELKEFYYNLLSYCLVIPFLIFINYWTSWHFQWFWFPMFGWGIGLVFHAYKVFVDDGVLGRNWERKKIEQFMREEEERSRWN